MRSLPVVLEFLILVIIACLMISTFAVFWIALMKTIWHELITPRMASCGRILTTHIELYSHPSLYQLRGPSRYRWLDLMCHPYFHPSLKLSRLERYFLSACKTVGLLLSSYAATRTVWPVAIYFAKVLIHGITDTNRLFTTTTKSPYRFAAGEVLHWPAFWISNLIEAASPALGYQRIGTSNKRTPSIACRVQHGFSFWFSNLLQPTFAGQPLAQLRSSSHRAQSLETPSEPSSIPRAHDQPKHTQMNYADRYILPVEKDLTGFMSSFVFVDTDPFESLLVDDNFRPLATSSPRGSSPNVNICTNDIIANSTSHEFDFDPIAIGYSEDICKVADSPRIFFGTEGDTLVDALGDGSPLPRISGSSKHHRTLWLKTIDLGDTLTAAFSTASDKIAGVLAEDCEESVESELASTSSSTSPSNPLVPGVLGVSLDSKYRHARTHSRKEPEPAICNFSSFEATVPSTTVNVKADRGVKRISRDSASVVLDIFKRSSKVHIRSLSGNRFTEAQHPFYDTSIVFHEPIDSANQVYSVSDAEVSASRPHAIDVGSFAGPSLPLSSTRCSSSITPEAEETPVEGVYVDNKVRRMAVGKTRIFEDALKKATASLRPGKIERRDNHDIILS